MQISTNPGRARGAVAETADASASGHGAVVGDEPASPVFVDGSGKRRKGWRRVTIGVVGVLCGYAVLLGVSFAGGPIPPGALLPVPGVPNGQAPATTAGPTDGASQAAGPGGAQPKTDRGAVTGAAATRTGPGSTTAAKAGATVTTVPQPTTLPATAPSPTPTATGSTTVTHGRPTTQPSHSHSKTP